MKPSTGTWFASVIMLIMLMTGAIGSIYAQTGGQPTAYQEDNDIGKLRLHAEVLQKMIQRALTAANISKGLETKAGGLASINLTVLNSDELREFIDEAKSVLSRIRAEMSSGGAGAGKETTVKFLEKIHERLNRTLMKLNVSNEEAEEMRAELRKMIREALQGKLTFQEAKHFVRDLAEKLIRYRVLNFTSQMMNYTERQTKLGRLRGLEIALNASSKVFQVLKEVKERLQKVNASPAAVAAIEHAIERIAFSRDVLKQLIFRMPQRHEAMNATPGQVEKEFKNLLREKVKDLNETIRENLRILRELRSEAEEKDLKSLVETIDQAISKLEYVASKIQLTNMCFGEVMEVIASAKTVIAHAEKVLEKASEESKMSKKVSEELNSAVNKLEKKLAQLKKKLNELGNQTIEKIDKPVRDLLSKAENFINEAKENIEKGNLTSAAKLLNRASAALKSAENIISSVEKAVEHGMHGGR